MLTEPHTHGCPNCPAEFECHCPDPMSRGGDALVHGWRYACPACDPDEYVTDEPMKEWPHNALSTKGKKQ